MTTSRNEQLLHDALDRLWLARYRPEDVVQVVFGRTPPRGGVTACVPAGTMWSHEPLHHKYRSILSDSWRPSKSALRTAGVNCILEDLVGEEADFGPDLVRTILWHHDQDWPFDALTDADSRKADALERFSVLARIEFRDFGHSWPPLNLSLAKRCFALQGLVYPMAVKIPLISVRYYVDWIPSCAFQAVRAAGHPRADGIVSYLYELLFLQQKTGVCLLDFLRLGKENREHKGDASLTQYELRQILCADLLITYLKASLEKTIMLLGEVFEVKGLEGRKTHKSRLKALYDGTPKRAWSTLYADLLSEMIDSRSFEALGRLRSGLLHKRGVSRLQPHSFSSVEPREGTDLEVFAELHEQHSKNSAALIAALAMLTDDLVRRDPPPDSHRTLQELFSLMQHRGSEDVGVVWSPSERTGGPFIYDTRPGVRLMKNEPRQRSAAQQADEDG